MKKNLTNFLIIMIITTIFTGCAFTTTTTKQEVLKKYTYSFKQSPDDLVTATKLAVKQLDWTISDNLDKVSIYLMGGVGASFTSNEKKAWENTAPLKNATSKNFIEVRTPISVFSYGALIYVSIYEFNNTSYIKMAASTSQMIEKKNLSKYLNTLQLKIKSNLKQNYGDTK